MGPGRRLPQIEEHRLARLRMVAYHADHTDWRAQNERPGMSSTETPAAQKQRRIDQDHEIGKHLLRGKVLVYFDEPVSDESAKQSQAAENAFDKTWPTGPGDLWDTERGV